MIGKYGDTTQMVREVIASEDRIWTHRDIEERMGECNASGILATLARRGEIVKVGQRVVDHARLNQYRATEKLGQTGKRGPKDMAAHREKILAAQRKRVPEVEIQIGNGILGVTVHRMGE